MQIFGKVNGDSQKPNTYMPGVCPIQINFKNINHDFVTPEMAVHLEIAFGKPSADHWLRLQNAYNLWQTRQQKESLHVSPFNFQAA